MKNRSFKSWFLYLIPSVVFIAFTFWWIYLRQFDLEISRNQRQLWGALYQILALYGGLLGLVISNKWGGYKSLMGRIIMCFSIGLLLQTFGQSYSSYFVYHYQVEAPPYPAIGDIGFFGSVLAYIYGVILIAKISGIHVSLKKTTNRILLFILPLAAIIFTYFFFLKDYSFDWSDKIKVILDFGYPFGQAIYVSIAFLALFMSRNVLGVLMKKPLLFLIFALIVQYFSDFMFLYEANLGNWHVGNINDYLYSLSYFVMLISLLKLGDTFEQIRNS
jgi:hypothetical protein